MFIIRPVVPRIQEDCRREALRAKKTDVKWRQRCQAFLQLLVHLRLKWGVSAFLAKAVSSTISQPAVRYLTCLSQVVALSRLNGMELVRWNKCSPAQGQQEQDPVLHSWAVTFECSWFFFFFFGRLGIDLRASWDMPPPPFAFSFQRWSYSFAQADLDCSCPIYASSIVVMIGTHTTPHPVYCFQIGYCWLFAEPGFKPWSSQSPPPE
jgi:hypothetical protein